MPLPAARPWAMLGASADRRSHRGVTRPGGACVFAGHRQRALLQRQRRLRIAAGKVLGIPLVITLHGETVMDDNDIYDHSWLLRTGFRMGLRRADAVSACSQFVLADAIGRFGLKPGNGLVVPDGTS